MSENNNNKISPKDSQDGLLRYLLGHGLIDQVELDECIQAQQALTDQNEQTSISGMLVAHGYLTPKQIERIKSRLEADKPLRQIPGFQMLEKIGSGAMATVYRAKQISLDRIVAVKIMPKHLSRDREFVERFYKEGQAAAQLNHNNIVQAIDVGEAGGYHYFVMEYVEGESIHEQMARGKKFTEKEALNIITQTARALAHAHERGFIHRDVKPKNIMLTSDGLVKLADLGLAREIADLRAAASEAGRAYGTPYYIAPEQIRGERDLDARIDIYSLGATAYHMVTGRVPFEGPNPSAIMHKHLKQELVPPDHINTKLSAGTAEVIEMMMAKKRDDRYKNAKDMLMDLECIAKGESPLLARERLDAKLLTGLAEESSVSGQQVTIEGPIPTGDAVKAQTKAKPISVQKPPPTPVPVAPILILALIISIIINVLLVIYAIFRPG
ncbi:MAG: serine/threonine protein kinase [Phycisphaerae bacterium]|nr:serine/threonine protein kinase [Phycisphaerae bacterium]